MIWSDEKHVAFLDAQPIALGHTLVIPRAHAAHIEDMDSVAAGELFTVAHALSKKIQKATGCKRIAFLVEGFSIGHVHIHLIPLNTARELEEELAKPKHPEVTPLQMEQVAHAIKAEIAR